MACAVCKAPIRRENSSGLCAKHYNKIRTFPNIVRATPDDIARLRVDRDPCTYCGVRADIGCKHNRWAA